MQALQEATILANKLSPAEKLKLLKHLAMSLEDTSFEKKKPQDLYGSWKGKAAEDVDIEAIIREIRDEWKEELDEYAK